MLPPIEQTNLFRRFGRTGLQQSLGRALPGTLGLETLGRHGLDIFAPTPPAAAAPLTSRR
jgi:hypothetical protein